MSRVIALANQKGGVGKTTTAINLGAALARAGQRVLIFDFDPQANSSAGLGIRTKGLSSYEVVIGGASAIDAAVATSVDGLMLIPATPSLAGADVELVPMMAREFRLKRGLESVRNAYDYVFIDCPPSLGLLTLNALTAADSVLIPMQCEYYALEGLSQLMHTVELVKQGLNPALQTEGILLTMFDGRANIAHQVAEEVRGFFPNLVFGSVVPRNVRLSECPSFGKPILLYDIKSKGCESYLALGNEIMRREKARAAEVVVA